MNNLWIIDELNEMASKNTYGYPFSAILFHNGHWFFAVNTVILDNNPSAHAEINVIKKACSFFQTVSLKGAIIYSSGEPCPMCLSAIAWAEIKDVFYLNSYEIANKKGFFIDQNCLEVNKLLKFNLNIQKIG